MTRDRPRGTRERRREGVQAGPPESRTWQTRLSGGPSIERRESKACSRAGMSLEPQPRRAAAEDLSKARATACGSARAARFERTSPRAARDSETPTRSGLLDLEVGIDRFVRPRPRGGATAVARARTGGAGGTGARRFLLGVDRLAELLRFRLQVRESALQRF